jgi:hypothetical protein
MAIWTFFEFVEPSGRAPFTEWMKALPEQAQARIDTRLLEMEGMNSWPEKWVSSYKGYESLIELRIPFTKCNIARWACILRQPAGPSFCYAAL